LQNDKLIFKPCFPLEWPSVSITYKYGTSTYYITVLQHNRNKELVGENLNKPAKENVVQLVDDGHEHKVEVHILVDKPNK